MTSEIPRTSVPCSNSEVIKSQPCFLFSIGLTSGSCLSLHSCVSQSCTHYLLCFLSHFQYPQLMHCSLTLYIRHHVYYLICLNLNFDYYSNLTSDHSNITLNS